MFAIATMYLCAGISYAWEGKVEWCVVAFCWGIGNLVLGYISK